MVFSKLTIKRITISSKKISTTILLFGLIILYFIPKNSLFNGPSLCIHKWLLGFDCPGCGMTRALYSFMHLDFKTAIVFNSAVFVLVPLLMTEIALGFRFDETLFKIRRILYYTLSIALLIIYIYRILTQIIL